MPTGRIRLCIGDISFDFMAGLLAIDETVTVMLLSLSCLLSLYYHAYCHLLSSTVATVIMVKPYQPFLPAVTISK